MRQDAAASRAFSATTARTRTGSCAPCRGSPGCARRARRGARPRAPGSASCTPAASEGPQPASADYAPGTSWAGRSATGPSAPARARSGSSSPESSSTAPVDARDEHHGPERGGGTTAATRAVTGYAAGSALSFARVGDPQALEELVGQRQVVGAEVGAVVEDRDAALGRLSVGDRRADRGLEDLLAVLASARRRSRGSGGAHVRDVQHDADPVEVLVVQVAGDLEHVEDLDDALQREVLGLGVISAWSAATRPLTVSSPSEGGQSIRTMS